MSEGAWEKSPHNKDIIEIQGKRYLKVPSGYTIRAYYSHDGPGWDHRFSLADPAFALAKFGRTFTDDEIFHPETLPEEPYYKLEEIDGDG